MRRRSGHGRLAWALVALAAWTLFAFAGAYPWTIAPLAAGTLAVAAAVRPALVRRPHRLLDLALLACLAVIACQLVPLPAAQRLALSPRVGVVDLALWVGAPLDARTAPPLPLSIDVRATQMALALAVIFLLLFWSARSVLSRGGGVRTLARGVALTGLALAVVALAQHATAPGLLYWYYPTLFGAPFGPYRNRNDFATWLIMATPVTVGYIAARIETMQPPGARRFELRHAVDGSAVWLAGSVCLMSAALVTSLSRSGLLGAGAALLLFLWLSRGRITRAGRIGLLACGTAVLGIALTYVQFAALKGRVDETLAMGLGGRETIWRESWRMARDFLVTGVGAGAYERGMLVYQQTRNGFQFNHAHNEYLQLVVEGGWLLAVPAALALIVGIWQIGQRLRDDKTAIFWIRAGAASSIAAIAVQNVWDTGLRMPANAVLFALVAAVALHDSGDSHRSPAADAPSTELPPRRRRSNT